MKKVYVNPTCVEQVLTVNTSLFASYSVGGGDKPKPGSAPARHTEPF